MSRSGGAAKLQRSLKDLREHWAQVKEKWNDRMREKFDEEYMTPLQMQVLQVLTAADQLDETLARARRECS